MKKIRELIRLKKECCLTNRQVAAALNISASTVSYYIRAANIANISWPLPDCITDKQLFDTLQPHCIQLQQTRKFDNDISWEEINKEMQHKHVTLKLLHEEYIDKNPYRHYSYSHFARQYKLWRKNQQTSMSISHKYGDKCFIDFVGDTIPIYNKEDNIAFNAHIFVAVLGASGYTFSIALANQKLSNWIDANVKALEFFGGVPQLLVPDNLRSAVSDSCKYEPEINPTYSALASHYGTVILPARAYKPKDKAMVENAVLIIERWIIARLRKHKFYSLGALNNKLSELMIALNNKPYQKKSGSRYSVFMEQEKKHLKPLAAFRYEYADFIIVKVQKDYHISVNNRFYSVPYNLVGSTLECRVTNNILEIMHDGMRIASHVINPIKGSKNTLDEHMPKNHLEHQRCDYEIFLAWAKNIGDGTFNLANEVIKKNKHKEQTYRFHLGLKQLLKRYSASRINNASLRMLSIGSTDYKSINSMLSKNLDLHPHVVDASNLNNNKLYHNNIRGNTYFQ